MFSYRWCPLSHEHSSIYQDIPLYTVDEFHERAPEALRQESTASDHALMLARLNFELQERQRCVLELCLTVKYLCNSYLCARLDQKLKQLTQAKEELLRQSKEKSTSADNVNAQLDLLLKVCSVSRLLGLILMNL